MRTNEKINEECAVFGVSLTTDEAAGLTYNGACASTVAAVLNGYCDKDENIRVQLLGGELVIKYTDDAILMTGECRKVFEGTVEI